jgi:hypothetical protein
MCQQLAATCYNQDAPPALLLLLLLLRVCLHRSKRLAGQKLLQCLPAGCHIWVVWLQQVIFVQRID